MLCYKPIPPISSKRISWNCVRLTLSMWGHTLNRVELGGSDPTNTSRLSEDVCGEGHVSELVRLQEDPPGLRCIKGYQILSKSNPP
jgi:hypothetical protein